MKSKSFMLMILSMGFGLIAAIGISQVMGRSAGSSAPATVMGPVLVAADHLDMNVLLTTENVKIENWPANIIPEDAATTIEEISDMVIRTRLSKGMPIVKSTIINKNQRNDLTIPEGFKVVAIKVSGDDMIGGLLSPGDKVDVIGLFKRRNSLNVQQTTTRTFLKALRVFSVNNKMTANEDRQNGNGSGSAIVGVLVTEKQSEEIYYVQRTGEIKLVLRGDYVEGDNDVEALADIMDWDDLDDDQEAEDAEEAAAFATKSAGPQGPSMIVWEGNSPTKVVFQSGAIPTRSDGSSNRRSSQVDEDDDEDFDDSEEIDRSLDEDQYPSE
jgi:pilus assembly protein CpaB